MTTYKESGVDIEAGDTASKILYNAAKETFKNRAGDIGEIIVPTDDFSGVRAIDVSKLPAGSLMCMGFDGVGTKVEIAQRVGDHSTIAFDLLAMVCDDAIVRGAEPVLVGSVLDVNTLNQGEHIALIKELAQGYVSAAKAANVAIINGELAELGFAVGGHGDFKYNWCAGLVWFARKEKLFTGKEIKVGDSIVLFEEKGFRANGLSLLRKTLEKTYGDNWHTKEFQGKTLGKHALVPSTIYSRAIVAMHGGFRTEGTCKIHGVVHITGSGLPGKLARVLKHAQLGAELHDLFTPCTTMLHCQKIGNITDDEAYRTWNMGQGLAVITPEPEKIIAEAKCFDLHAKIAGKVISEKHIKLKSKGALSEGTEIVFPVD